MYLNHNTSLHVDSTEKSILSENFQEVAGYDPTSQQKRQEEQIRKRLEKNKKQAEYMRMRRANTKRAIKQAEYMQMKREQAKLVIKEFESYYGRKTP